MLPTSVRHLVRSALLAAAYLAVALVGLTFAIPPGNATAVWPASGVALAAVMVLGTRVWPGIWLGALLANSTTTVSLATAAIIATGNTLEALLAAWLFRRVVPGTDGPFERVDGAFLFAAVAGVASIVAATLGGASLVLGGYAPLSQFPANWGTWWLGDVAGLMIVVPLVLTCAKPRPGPWGDTRRAELVVVFALIILASQAIFGGWLSEPVAEHLLYIPLIFLVWVCLRFDLPIVTLATALFSSSVIAGTSAGLGPFRAEAAQRSLFHLQMFVNLYALTGLAFAAVVAGRRASERRLQRSHEELEQIVRDRTDALIVANAGLHQEMAEHQKAEESLRERESRYRELIAHLHVGVVVHAPDTSILLSNDRAAELLGVTTAQMPGKTDDDPAWSFVREDGTPLPTDEYPVNQVLATQQPLRDLVYGIHRPSAGDLRWVLVNALPEFGGERDLVRVVVTFMDITDRRRLQELEMLRLDAALESIGDSIIITDDVGTIKYVNPAFERVTGYSRLEVAGRNPRVLQSGQHDHAFYRRMWGAVANGETWHGEFVDKRKDGRSYDAETTISQIRDTAGRAIGYVGVQRDISERKRTAAVTEQLRLARSIQESFFPGTSPVVPGFDLAGASYPADETGGDYYDYFQLADGQVAVVVADVSGHGFGPALVMSQTRAYLQALLLLGLGVGELATRLNDFLLADGQEARFVTLFLAQLDPRNGSFVYASAGHRGYVLGPGDDVQPLDATSVPLGILPGRVPSAPLRTLQPGQVVLLPTDGVEETESPQGVPFGIERALDVVRANRHRSAAEIVETLYRSARSFAQDSAQQDDITAVVLKVENPPRPAGL
jgi:sigma-B regulation protein RsbU (phosphoserine phosphatase)